MIRKLIQTLVSPCLTTLLCLLSTPLVADPIILHWTAPTTKTDGSPQPFEEIAFYHLEALYLTPCLPLDICEYAYGELGATHIRYAGGSYWSVAATHDELFSPDQTTVTYPDPGNWTFYVTITTILLDGTESLPSALFIPLDVTTLSPSICARFDGVNTP